MTRRCVIIGLEDTHVLIDSLRASDPEVSIVAIDRDTALHGKTVRGVEVIGGDNKLESWPIKIALFHRGWVDQRCRAAQGTVSSGHGTGAGANDHKPPVRDRCAECAAGSRMPANARRDRQRRIDSG